MSSLDTTGLVRYLVKDDVRQHALAVKVIESEGHGDIFLSLLRLLEINGMAFQDELSIERALSLFVQHMVDFASSFAWSVGKHSIQPHSVSMQLLQIRATRI